MELREYDVLLDLLVGTAASRSLFRSSTMIPPNSLSMSTASSSRHSRESSSSWKYVKLTVESSRDRRWAKDITLEGTLSDIGPENTCDTFRNIPTSATENDLANVPRHEPFLRRMQCSS